MTDTIDVAALVERLQSIDQDDDHDLYVNAGVLTEAATALQSQADALAEARRHEANANDLLRQSLDGSRSVKGQIAAALGCEPTIEAIIAAATTAEASLATMREALERADAVIEKLDKLSLVLESAVRTADGRNRQSVLELIRAARDARALGGSNAE